MEILKIDPQNPDPIIIDKTVSVLKNGGVIIYPTDTCYGIGASATNQSARNRIYKIKRRQTSEALSVIVPDTQSINKYAHITPEIESTLAKNLPGAYSFLLVNTDYSICPLSSLVVRIPNYPVTQKIAEKFNQPFTTTSANISGQPPAYSIKELEDSLLNEDNLIDMPDLILDAGDLPKNPPSTIVDLTSNPYKIIRQGGAEFII